MKFKLLSLVPILLLLMGCTEEVLIGTSGTIELTFSERNTPLANVEISITAAPGNDLNRRNENNEVPIFKGTTNEEGLINIDPLTAGHYEFKLLTNQGILYGEFQVIAGQVVTRTIDISDYYASLTIDIPILPASKSSSFYLLPSSFDPQSMTDTDIRQHSITATMSNNTLAINNILAGDYVLLVDVNGVLESVQGNYANLIALDSRFDVSYTLDFYDLPVTYFLDGEQWNENATLDGSGTVTSGPITSVNFTGNTCTFTFLDGSTAERNFSYSLTGGSDITRMTIFLSGGGDGTTPLNPPTVGTIQTMTIDFTNDFQMDLLYYNQDFSSSYSATLDLASNQTGN